MSLQFLDGLLNSVMGIETMGLDFGNGDTGSFRLSCDISVVQGVVISDVALAVAWCATDVLFRVGCTWSSHLVQVNFPT